MSSGALVTLIWNLYPPLQWQEIHPGLWGLVVNFVVLIVVSLATKRMDEAHVKCFVVS